MLNLRKANNVLDARPRLTRVWINTGDLRMPLKAIWLDETKLRSVANAGCSQLFEDAAAELTDDHLWLLLEIERVARGSARRLKALSRQSPIADRRPRPALAILGESQNVTMHLPA